MPLYKIIEHNSSTRILIWNITESFEQLNQEVQLNEKNQLRLNGMKSEMHQRAFLSVRKLLALSGYSDFDLEYDEFGKPHLIDEKHISITHSHHFSAIIVSNEAVGIDIEMQREKILKIAHKFVNPKELNQLQTNNIRKTIRKLTVNWGAKEAVFKIKNEKGISFKDHIEVAPFEIKEHQTQAVLNYQGVCQNFTLFFDEIETNFTLVYAFDSEFNKVL